MHDGSSVRDVSILLWIWCSTASFQHQIYIQTMTSIQGDEKTAFQNQGQRQRSGIRTMHMTKTFPKHDKAWYQIGKKCVQSSVEIRMEGRRPLELVREMCINVAWQRVNEQVKWFQSPRTLTLVLSSSSFLPVAMQLSLIKTRVIKCLAFRKE